MGGFIGEEAEFKIWIERKTHNWMEAVGELVPAMQVL
jgi:hypothetical protein